MARILVVDDDADLRRLLSLRLGSWEHVVSTASSGAEALSMVEHDRFDLVITDLRMGGMDGMALFDAIRKRFAALPVIVLTAHGTIPDAVAATQKGVHAYLTKPFEPPTLKATVEEALVAHGPAPTASNASDRHGILTRSPVMERLLDRARLLAATDTTLLVWGESGTGKELFARAVHEGSPRARGAFVAVNCAAIPENLLESELFGHKRGAFTGANTDKRGLITEASGGTLFLDEVGDMPLPFQAKLLRVLQEGEVRPVGSTRSEPVDIRVICATHRDLEAEVEAGRFREDLRYRLDVVRLELPPLAERREDIPLLAQHFLESSARRNRRSVRAFAPEAVLALAGAAWPGNVRQLQNVVEQCVALCTGPLVPLDLATEALRQGQGSVETLDEVRHQAERAYLLRILKLTEGNVSQAARLAGRNRTEFYKLLGRHDLEPGRFREEAGS